MSDKLNLAGATPTVWYVVFMARDTERWYDIFNPEWARHVMAFGFVTGSQSWIVYNPSETHTSVSVIPDDLFEDVLISLHTTEIRILKTPQLDGSLYNARVGNLCTQAIARLVGISSRAWRPCALYRDLLESGAEEVSKSYVSESP